MAIVRVTHPLYSWLFGGLGFHNSEATMLRIMPDDFLSERVLKTFREISPTFARVFAGFADWSKEAMDAFADYYDLTFRKAGTTLYLVPGRMPMPMEDFDCEEYAEKVALNLSYLINERKLTKIRYYCCTNELSCGNTYAYLKDHRELFIRIQAALYRAFRRHGLDIGLLATDASGIENFDQIEWAADNMDEITEVYCAHNYGLGGYQPGDLAVYPLLYEAYSRPVAMALRKEKRFILGEFGVSNKRGFRSPVMRNDVCCGFDDDKDAAVGALALAEDALAALNAGCLAAVQWTMFDYPNPMLCENGDTPEEKARYDVCRFSGHGLSIRYNKWGLVRWNDDKRDYSARPSLYTMGLLAKYLRKGSRVLGGFSDDDTLRVGAVSNPDGSITVVLINWGEDKTVDISVDEPIHQPMRRYTYRVDEPPVSAFNDLQPFDALIDLPDGNAQLALPARSMTLFTTDYADRVPSCVRNVHFDGDRLVWDACEDKEHCYYRVLQNGEQMASTVSESLKRDTWDASADYRVVSVDRYGNCGQ